MHNKKWVVCYNKDSVGASCPLQHAYFGVITEIGGLSGRKERRERVTWRGYEGRVQATRNYRFYRTGSLVPVRGTCEGDAVSTSIICCSPCCLSSFSSFFTTLRTFNECLLEFSDDSSYLQSCIMLFDVNKFVADPSKTILCSLTKAGCRRSRYRMWY